MSRGTILLSIVGLLAVVATVSSFEITFPGPTDYWVACGWNNMTWKSQPSDPHVVTIMLTNSNKTLLNDDFEIGNALEGTHNAAMIYVPCLPANSGYSLLFVNSSHYDHKQDKVLYTSPQFIIKPKGTAPDPASGQANIPSQIQPYLQTPGIVLPPTERPGEVTNTASHGNGTNDALPRLDGASASFGSFHPTSHTNAASAPHILGDLIFIATIAAFTILVVTT